MALATQPFEARRADQTIGAGDQYPHWTFLFQGMPSRSMLASVWSSTASRRIDRRRQLRVTATLAMTSASRPKDLVLTASPDDSAGIPRSADTSGLSANP